ncbi:MAG: hypothetical protein OXG86_07075 [Chloroflexi bacterium]|nr:hypothetical protein [Chloroflexota bacterium]
MDTRDIPAARTLVRPIGISQGLRLLCRVPVVVSGGRAFRA